MTFDGVRQMQSTDFTNAFIREYLTCALKVTAPHTWKTEARLLFLLVIVFSNKYLCSFWVGTIYLCL